MVKHSGFSLIEVMVTIAILILLVVIGASLSITWIQRAKVREAESKLKQAYSMTVAIAQRNAVGATQAATAAGMKRDGRYLLVCSGDLSGESCAAGKPALQWKSELPTGATVKINGNTEATLTLDNTGAARNGSGTLSGTAYEISYGHENGAGNLH